jgi:hypothetical protein
VAAPLFIFCQSNKLQIEMTKKLKIYVLLFLDHISVSIGCQVHQYGNNEYNGNE